MQRRAWSPSLVETIRLVAELVASAVQRLRQDLALRDSEQEVRRLAAAVERETEPFDPDLDVPQFEGIVGRSPALRSALARLHEVAPTNSSVLLLGETGTGKELFARAIHYGGPRRAHPLVVVNCAALPAALIESELFGHSRGAFTGAITTRQGRFELANRGTLFLDEIGDLPLDLQTKLLRVLQEGTFERVGSSQTQNVDVRIIAATHRDLRQAIAEHQFRDDLYYRLSVFPIRIPSLRDRREDIRELVWFIIHKRQRAMRRSITRVPDGVMQALQQYDWPGNVRELENVIERALIHSTGDTLNLLDDHVGPSAPPDMDGTLVSVERSHISDVLNACGGRINGTGNAAERLGMHPNTLRFRMKKLGIVRKNGPWRPGNAGCVGAGRQRSETGPCAHELLRCCVASAFLGHRSSKSEGGRRKEPSQPFSSDPPARWRSRGERDRDGGRSRHVVIRARREATRRQCAFNRAASVAAAAYQYARNDAWRVACHVHFTHVTVRADPEHDIRCPLATR